jgi:type I restriction enzyme R subunit
LTVFINLVLYRSAWVATTVFEPVWAATGGLVTPTLLVTESERPALDTLQQLGWEVVDQQRTIWHDPRETESSAVLEPHLRDAVERLNPWINENNPNKAVREIQQITGTSTMDENEQIHEKLVRHTDVKQDLGHGMKHQTVKYIDYENPENNDFFALNQFRVEGPMEVIKPDIILFVNGIPLGVVECKAPTIVEPRSEALEQLQRYQNERTETGNEGAEELFRYNQFSVATWYEGAVMGTYGTPKGQYKPWRDPYPLTDDDLADRFGVDYVSPQLRMLYALFEPERLLDQLRHFTVFDTNQSGSMKLVARYQQYRAVEKALKRIERRSQREAQGGVVWHTQGSGKSLTMLFLGLKLRRAKPDRSWCSSPTAPRLTTRYTPRSSAAGSRTRGRPRIWTTFATNSALTRVRPLPRSSRSSSCTTTRKGTSRFSPATTTSM